VCKWHRRYIRVMLFRERHGPWLSASNLVAPGPLWASWRGAAYPGGRGRRRGFDEGTGTTGDGSLRMKDWRERVESVNGKMEEED
jgi:hypothetical protein